MRLLGMLKRNLLPLIALALLTVVVIVVGNNLGEARSEAELLEVRNSQLQSDLDRDEAQSRENAKNTLVVDAEAALFEVDPQRLEEGRATVIEFLRNSPEWSQDTEHENPELDVCLVGVTERTYSWFVNIGGESGLVLLIETGEGSVLSAEAYTSPAGVLHSN